MKTNGKFNAARRNGASPRKRSKPASKASTRWSKLRQCLHDTPDSRPDAVLRAKMLIEDPGYPPDNMAPALALRLAFHLVSEIDSLPT